MKCTRINDTPQRNAEEIPTVMSPTSDKTNGVCLRGKALWEHTLVLLGGWASLASYQLENNCKFRVTKLWVNHCRLPLPTCSSQSPSPCVSYFRSIGQLVLCGQFYGFPLSAMFSSKLFTYLMLWPLSWELLSLACFIINHSADGMGFCPPLPQITIAGEEDCALSACCVSSTWCVFSAFSPFWMNGVNLCGM